MNQTNPAHILQQIAQIQHMEPGKLCVIGQGPNGPYYNLQCREGGKILTLYVPADQVPLVIQHTANYQQFQGLVGQYARSLSSKPVPSGRPPLKERGRARSPPGARPGNPAVDGQLPGQGAQRGLN
jgi:hypothetical protein